MKWIDLTHTIKSDMSHSPYDEALRLREIKTIDKDSYSDSFLETTMHIGTHIDAPSHMIKGGKNINDYPIDHFIGRGIVLNFENEKEITLRDDDKDRVSPGDIVIIHTNQHKSFDDKTYYEDYPVMTEDFANFLIENKVKAIILDSFSPDKHPFHIHKLLLSQDILIVENAINTDLLVENKKEFEAYIIPIKIHASGAFVRTFVKITN